MSNPNPRTITLISSDNDELTISYDAMYCRPAPDKWMSELVHAQVEDQKQDEDLHYRASLPIVSTETLKQIIDFINLYSYSPMKEIEKPLKSSVLADLVGVYFAKIVDEPTQEELFKLTNAANFMNIPPLLALCCAKVATMIKSQSPEQIRKMFGVGDITPQEEQTVRQYNRWCEE